MLNRERNREPSSLLEQVIADTKRQLSSPAARQRQMVAGLGRSALSPLNQAIAAAKPRSLSPTRQVLADLARYENNLATRVLGTPRPVVPAPAKQRKRKPGAGRKPSLTPAQVEDGTRLLHGQPRMTVEAARATLREAGINGKGTALYELIIKPAYASLRK